MGVTGQRPKSQRHHNQVHRSADALRNLKVSLEAGEVDKGLYDLKRAAACFTPHDAQFLYSSSIKACGEFMEWESAVNLLEHMHSVGIHPNTVCYNAAMTACVRSKQAEHALTLWEVFHDKLEMQADNYTASAVLKAYAMQEMYREAIEFLIKLPKMGVIPNQYVYCATINACEQGRQVGLAMKIFQLMQDRGVQPNTRTCTSLINACKAESRWQDAVQILDGMASLGLVPDWHTYSAAISACAKAGKFHPVLRILEKIRSSGLEPNLVTYGAILSACATGNQWRKALEILNSMTMDPDEPAYYTVISALKRASRWEEAVQVLTKMKQKGMIPDKRNYESVVHLCYKAGQVQIATDLFNEAARHGIKVNPPTAKKQSTEMEQNSTQAPSASSHSQAARFETGLQAVRPPGLVMPSIIQPDQTIMQQHTHQGQPQVLAPTPTPAVQEPIRRSSSPSIPSPSKLSQVAPSPTPTVQETRQTVMNKHADHREVIQRPSVAPPLPPAVQQALAVVKAPDFDANSPDVQAALLNKALRVAGQSGAWDQAVDIFLVMTDQETRIDQDSLAAAADACSRAHESEWLRVLQNHQEFLQIHEKVSAGSCSVAPM